MVLQAAGRLRGMQNGVPGKPLPFLGPRLPSQMMQQGLDCQFSSLSSADSGAPLETG